MSSGRSKAPAERLLRVVINDASCLIDLHKADLVRAMLGLPYRFVVALPVRVNELLGFEGKQWRALEAAGLEVIDLDGPQVARVFALRATHAALSAEDCFSLVLAEDATSPILLTGDAALRKVAERRRIEVHGVLWVVDQLGQHALAGKATLLRSLELWRDDPLVRLPGPALAARLRRLRGS